MIYRVEMTTSARRELRSAHSYIKIDLPIAARRWHTAMKAAIKALETMPQRCAVAPDRKFAGEELRHSVVRPYRIIFKIKGDSVEIISVRHSSQQFLGE